ncbi:MAG: hypothetical protein AABY42_08270 [Nitrospirota bacterium]
MKINGLIDLHTHGFGGYDTRASAPEHILKMARLYKRAGTDAFLPTIYPSTIDDMRANMEAVKRAMQVQSSEFRVKIQNPKSKIGNSLSAVILGVHLEGPFLNPVRCGALDKSSFIRPTLSNFKKLIYGFEDMIRIITVAPEMPGALKIIERCSELGIKVNMGHSDATYREASEGMKAGSTGITHIFNAMRPFHHREPGLAGFGLSEDIFIEVIADGVHIHPLALNLIFSVKKKERIILVSDSVKGAKGDGRPVYASGKMLAGSGITMKNSIKVLRKIGVSGHDIGIFKSNPLRYLTKNLIFGILHLPFKS